MNAGERNELIERVFKRIDRVPNAEPTYSEVEAFVDAVLDIVRTERASRDHAHCSISESSRPTHRP